MLGWMTPAPSVPDGAQTRVGGVSHSRPPSSRKSATCLVLREGPSAATAVKAHRLLFSQIGTSWKAQGYHCCLYRQ